MILTFYLQGAAGEFDTITFSRYLIFFILKYFLLVCLFFLNFFLLINDLLDRAGVGNPLSPERTRMLLALRINVMAKGHSGISLETLHAMIQAFNGTTLNFHLI